MPGASAVALTESVNYRRVRTVEYLYDPVTSEYLAGSKLKRNTEAYKVL